MAEIARAVLRVEKDELFSSLCFLSSIWKPKQKFAVRCTRPQRPLLRKKVTVKITRASMTSADLLGDAQCITSSIDNCRLSVVESPTCRRRKSHHINGNALVATKSFGWR
jgi:hypothetical protein